MLRGLYTAATGMIAQQRLLETQSNNLANANTPGYKSDQTSLRAFPEMLISHMSKESIPAANGQMSSNPIGSINTGVYMQETMPTFNIQGALENTGNNTDIALIDVVMPVNNEGQQGSIFYTVANNEGDIRYTRNGSFTRDQQGYLTTSEGNYLISREGTYIYLQDDDFKVTENGQIFVNDTYVNTISVGYAENPNELVKEGNGLYRVDNPDGVLPSAYTTDGVQFSLQQGYIERSNVDSAQTMTSMMNAYRAFEANQKILQAYDSSLDKAVNQVGKV